MTEPELPPLYFASVADDRAEVERLLQAGADPNDGESVFHAAEKNHRAVIDLLMQYGCDISSAHAMKARVPDETFQATVLALQARSARQRRRGAGPI